MLDYVLPLCLLMWDYVGSTAAVDRESRYANVNVGVLLLEVVAR